MAGEQDPPADDQDPTADTPDETVEDTADDAADAAEDWDPKSRDEARKKVSEMGRENARLRAQLAGDDSDDDDDDDGDADDDDDSDDDDADAGDDEQTTERFNRDSWALARSSYGDEAIDAYRAVYRTGALAAAEGSTPMDVMTGLMLFHERMTNGKPTKGKPAGEGNGAPAGEGRPDPRMPRVDTNASGSDSGNQSEAGKSLEQVVGGRIAKFFGPRT